MNAVNDANETAAHIAALQGRTYALGTLLQRRARIDLADSTRGNTLLHNACQGMSEKQPLFDPRCLLCLSCSLYASLGCVMYQAGGHFDCVLLLLDAGANVRVTNKFGETALHLAAASGNVDCLRAILKQGAVKVGVETPNTALTPLHVRVVT